MASFSCHYIETLKEHQTGIHFSRQHFPVPCLSGEQRSSFCLLYEAYCAHITIFTLQVSCVEMQNVALMSPTWKRETLSSHSHPSHAEFYITEVMPLSSLRSQGERHTGRRVVIISETSCLQPA